MPSEDRLQAALRAVARERDAFRSAVAATAEQIRGFLGSRNGATGPGGRAAAELGAFAAGRLDPERFATLVSEEGPADPAHVEAAERALSVLTGILGGGDAPFRVRVEAGGDPAAAVGDALARTGRAFGAARVAEAVRLGRYRAERDAFLLQSFPFGRWSRAEREAAPPLVVELDGEDLGPGGLAAYLDGGVKLVLIVDGPCPPAPLARLLTPGIRVLQTDDPEALAAVGGTPGPAIAALVPEACARFLHEPDAPGSGDGPRADDGDGEAGGGPASGWGRFTVDLLPEAPKGRLGASSAFQQAEELRLLAALAAPDGEGAPGAAEGAGAGAGRPAAGTTVPADPADRLAAWILHQADLSDLGAGAGSASSTPASVPNGAGSAAGAAASGASASDASDASGTDAAPDGEEGRG